MKYINALIFRIRKFFSINLIKTIIFNFYNLPISQAIHFPVLLYGRVFLYDMSGKVYIIGPIKCGMIKIGYKWHDLLPSSTMPVQIISGGVGLFVQNKDASLTMGDETSIGGGSLIKSMDVITIGKRTSITGNCIIMDSNMHIVKDIGTGLVKKPWGPIIIGESCWINAGSIVNKGTVIPNYSITARNTFLNRDYSEFGENLFLVGSPAKITSARLQRIFGLRLDNELKKFFRENPNTENISLAKGVERDEGNHFN